MDVTEAGYEGLLPAQQQWFDHLMSSPVRGWPQGLREYCAEQAPGCGDEIAHAVGTWVKAQRD
jgi:hypothetical protein